jgi:zinc D-Ala-D-Ala carboxypeptidase
MKLSPNFTLAEATRSDWASRHKITNQPNAEQFAAMKHAAQCMEKVRALLGAPILVSSWLRVPMLNKAIGGSATSSHTLGYAIDFTCPKFGNTREIAQTLADSAIDFSQLILEFPDKPNGGWVHIDFNPKPNKNKLLTAVKPDGKTIYKAGIK